MHFTGYNLLILPQFTQYYFEFNNIVTTDYSPVVLGLANQSSQSNILLSGGKVLIPDALGNNNTVIGTYNTGENFNISGWYMQNSNGNDNFLYGMLSDITFKTTGILRDIASGIVISGDDLTCDVNIKSNTINYFIAIPNSYAVGGTCTGAITADTTAFNYSGSLIFYNSLQNLLTGSPVVGFIDSSAPASILLNDIDPTSQNNEIDFNITLNTISGAWSQNFTSSRTGLYSTLSSVINALESGVLISGLFNGSWSGTQFVYKDLQESINLDYYVSQQNSLGIEFPKTLSIVWSGLNQSGSYPTQYVTGFQLTSSGEYLYPPTVQFTGYYAVNNLQQSLPSFLFSSGCSGNLNVTFTPTDSYGAGASGTMITRAVLFQNIYVSGINTFYVVDQFQLLSGGTGYTNPPKAIINTGMYSNCYDVPTAYNSNIAWFLPANSRAVMSPLASYLTGEVMFNTGLVSGGQLTGYVVTGLNITNVGSGYSTSYFPKLSFIRLPNDSLTKNASGTLSLKQSGNYNFYSAWTLQTGIAGGDLIPMSGNSGSLFMDNTENYFSIQLSNSGLDNTQNLLVSLSFSLDGGATLQQTITGFKYYNTGSGFLKKKYNLKSGVFNSGSSLSFFLTQQDLNNFYSTNGFLGNSWGIDLGDLDF